MCRCGSLVTCYFVFPNVFDGLLSRQPKRLQEMFGLGRQDLCFLNFQVKTITMIAACGWRTQKHRFPFRKVYFIFFRGEVAPAAPPLIISKHTRSQCFCFDYFPNLVFLFNFFPPRSVCPSWTAVLQWSTPLY